MNLYVINFAYLISSVLFILGLIGLTSPRTARRGNILGALGMLVAVVATLGEHQIVSFELILLGIAIGTVIGAVAATAMRQILSNHARDKRAAKRGGNRVQLSIDELPTPAGTSALDLLDLDDALSELSALNARHARLVELRFFAGLSTDEMAHLLDISSRCAHWPLCESMSPRCIRQSIAAGELLIQRSKAMAASSICPSSTSAVALICQQSA